MLQINKIYNENNLETMSRMPDNFIDLTVTSPPYNMNLRIRNGKYCSRQIVKELSTKYESFSDNMPIDDFYEHHKRVLTELLRVSKIIFYNIQIVTGSKRAFFKLIGDFSNSLKDIIVWDKVNAQPSMSDKVLNRQSELILVFCNDGAISRKYNTFNAKRGTVSDTWAIKKQKSQSIKHGATFPEELAERIITLFSDSNALIYDPFIGTGTTAKMALINGRSFIGSEISSEYCDIANKRIAEFTP